MGKICVQIGVTRILQRPDTTFEKWCQICECLVGRKEPTRVSGFVLIRLGARAMNNLFQKLLKSGPPRRRGITRGPLRDY